MKKDKSVVSSFSYSSRLFHELLTSSNFGIPERLVPELNIRIKKHKKLRLYLSFLLNRLRSGKFRQRLPVFIGPKLQFQKAGQHLVNFQFRPYSKDWTELMLLARARGASANLIFITLVEFDLNEREESNVSELLEGVWLPKNPIKFLQSLDLRTGLWKRVLFFGRSSYHFYKDQRFNPSQ